MTSHERFIKIKLIFTASESNKLYNLDHVKSIHCTEELCTVIIANTEAWLDVSKDEKIYCYRKFNPECYDKLDLFIKNTK